MCSTTRGPAIAPSLVTCPTSTSAAPCAFAVAASSAAHSRTCATEPGADLALALALASSRLDLALPADAAACGEVGLGGEIRRVARLDARVAEAVRLGFRRVLVPAGAQDSLPAPRGARLVPVGDLAEAVAWLSSTAVHGAEADR